MRIRGGRRKGGKKEKRGKDRVVEGKQKGKRRKARKRGRILKIVLVSLDTLNIRIF